MHCCENHLLCVYIDFLFFLPSDNKTKIYCLKGIYEVIFPFILDEMKDEKWEKDEMICSSLWLEYAKHSVGADPKVWWAFGVVRVTDLQQSQQAEAFSSIISGKKVKLAMTLDLSQG